MAQDFTHLHVHSDGSLLDGANPVDKLIGRAKDLGMKSLALTDHGVMYNLWKFQEQAKKAGLNPILGMEAYVAPGHRGDKTIKTPMDKWYYHLVLLAQNEEGYKNLVKLSSLGFMEGFYYNPRLDREVLERHSKGLIVSSACLAGEVAQGIEAARVARAEGREDQAAVFEAKSKEAIEWYKKVFGERYFLEVQAHNSEGQAELNKGIFSLAAETNTKVVATTDAHFLKKDDHRAHDCLICVGMKKNMDDPDRLRYDGGLYFQDGNEVGGFFKGRTDVLDHTMEVADRVNLGFNKRYHVPSFPLDATEKTRLNTRVENSGGAGIVLSDKVRSDTSLSTEDLAQRAREVALLRELAEAGAKARYGDVLSDEVKERLEYELKVISDAGYAGYHLIVADFIRTARSEGIPVGPGRGSAAGSLVCYSLGITNVDPLHFGLLFERFLNPDRVSMPDIDVDFCYEGRGRVIDYVKDKYGHDAVCQIITFGTLQARAAVKDVGRVLGFSPAEMDEFAKLIPNAPNYSLTVAESITKVPAVRDRYNNDTRWKNLCDLAIKLEGLRRNAGVHAAGVVIAPGPVDDYVPVSLNKEGGMVSQYDMNDLEHAGMLKMDFLGLKTLTVLSDAVKNITALGETAPDLDRIPLDDAATYKMLADGKVAGVFQLESALAKDKLTAMKPDRIGDIIATNALLRPGPLDSGQTDAFIRRKRGEEAITYPHPLLADILKDTYGVLTYQEQIMKAVAVLAGYTLAEADMFRKAVGKKDADLIAAELARFVEKSVALGTCTPDQAKEVAALIETFGRYGFNLSHSVAYSVLGYQTAYLKAHHPEAFMAALLSSVMDNTDDTIRYLMEAKEMGITILAPHVNESGVKYTAVKRQGEKDVVRFGLTAIKGIGESMVNAILAARASGPFTDLFDFSHRVHQTGKLTSKVMTALIETGACDGLGPSRAAMLAVVEPLKKENDKVKKQRDRFNKQQEAAAALAPKDEGDDLFGKPVRKTKAVLEPSSAAVHIPYPDVPELEFGDMLAREKAALGLYVSGNPMDPYKEQAAALATHTASQLTEYKEGKIRIVGVITSVNEWTAKKSGNRTAKLTVEDLTGTMSVIAFSREYTNFEYLLKPGQLVVISGKFSESDRALDRAPDLQLDRAQGLMDALSAGDVAISISLDAALKADAGSMERIKQILAEHEGNAQVLIEDPPNKVREAKSKVRPVPELLEQLRAVIGAERVSVRRGVAAYDAKASGYQKGRGR